MSTDGNGTKFKTGQMLGEMSAQITSVVNDIGDIKIGFEQLKKTLIIMQKDGCSNLQDITNSHDSHLHYHINNEYKWGFWTLLKKKPLVGIIIGAIFAILLLSAGIGGTQILKAAFSLIGIDIPDSAG